MLATGLHFSLPVRSADVYAPWDIDGLRALPADASVDAGLSMVDAVVLLDEAGHRGPVTVFSRHGRRPHPRRIAPEWPEYLDAIPDRTTIRALFARVLAECRRATRDGGNWQSPPDLVRAHIGLWWHASDEAEKRRFLRHVRPIWETHHHRAPPIGHTRVEAAIAAGRLRHVAVSVSMMRAGEGGMIRAFRPRGGAAESRRFDAAIVSAGIEYDLRRLEEALPRNLLARGLVRPGPLALGIDATPGGRLIGRDGLVQPRLFALGPPLRGNWWESTAIPDIARQSAGIAGLLATGAALPAAAPQRLSIWVTPGPDYESTAARFRPVLARITDAFGHREHILPLVQIEELKRSGFTALRLPVEDGGAGLSFPDFLNLIGGEFQHRPGPAGAFRLCRGCAEPARSLPPRPPGAAAGGWRDHRRRLHRDRRGEGRGVLDPADAQRERPAADRRKFCTTGTLYADGIDVSASDEHGETVFAFVRRDAAGITVGDEWDGFGQRLSASGTTTFEDVAVAPENLWLGEQRLRYSTVYCQLCHLATLTGIGRALVRDTVAELAKRRRSFTPAAAPLPRLNPQVLQVLGKLRSQVYAAQAITLKAAEAVERAFADRPAEAAE